MKTAQESAVISSEYNDGVDLREVLSRLWYARSSLLAAVVVGLFLGAMQYLGSPPIYQADALLQLEAKNPALGLPIELSAALTDLVDDPQTVTEVEIIRSRMVLGAAVDQLNLDWFAQPHPVPVIGNFFRLHDVPLPDAGILRPYARKGDVITLAALHVPVSWIGINLLVTAGENGQYSIDLPDGRTLRGRVGELLSDETSGLVLEIAKIIAPAGREFDIMQLSKADVITLLRTSLLVAETSRQSLMLRLTFTDRSPTEATKILNAISEAYLRQNVNRSSAEAASSLNFIEQNLPDAEKAVEDAEAAIDDFSKSHQAVDLQFEAQASLSQLEALRSQREELLRQQKILADRYTVNHPIYRQTESDIKNVDDQIANLQEQINQLPGTQRELAKLTETLDTAQAAYLQLSGRMQELRVLQASKIGNVRIVDTAVALPLPLSPKLIRTLSGWSFASFGVCALIILIKGWFRTGVVRIADIEACGVPVLSVIGYIRRRHNHKQRVLISTEPDDPVVESLRSLRTALHFSFDGRRGRSLQITGTSPSDGKSFCSMNFAVVSAMTGQSVCLVDGDMRRGVIHHFFGIKRVHSGLSNYLEGKASLDDILVRCEVEGLWLITTGPLPRYPSELLMKPRFKELMTELEGRFDLTIVDSPPSQLVTDPVLISQVVAKTLIVVRHLVTTSAAITLLRKQVLAAGGDICGAVLNFYDPRRSGERYGYGYDYKYSYGKAYGKALPEQED